MLKAKQPKMPIMTIDADLAAADRALRKTYLGTNNYDMGVLMAKHLKELKSKGGSVCLQLGNPAADNINARAAGFRDTIGGKKGVDRLKGEEDAIAKKKDKVLLAVCDNGGLSGKAASMLRKAGYTNAFSLKGGLGGWRADNLPLVK